MNYEERRIAGSLKARASKVAEVARLKFWLFQKKSAADAFTALKLDQHMDDVLLSPKLNTLSTYVDMFNKKFPDSQVSLAGTLIAKYGDVAVAKALVRAKETSRSKDIASKLQTQQLEGWLNSHKSVEDVFTLLKIKDDGLLALTSRKLVTLDEYIQLFNRKNPQRQTNLFDALRGGFGEGEFARWYGWLTYNPSTAKKAF
ncbi:hypothetical protein F442_01468 [Phytophthora nicotianae P10297]|uniref:RxLR effector protein n=1 Tax=Phytophthora nicotianae P10297 TaxID=1317064 RepID=W3A3A0_PHYNI|nr:hypothetical protein F442_01468 [Phytophthora nicotianae P10297]